MGTERAQRKTPAVRPGLCNRFELLNVRKLRCALDQARAAFEDGGFEVSLGATVCASAAAPASNTATRISHLIIHPFPLLVPMIAERGPWHPLDGLIRAACALGSPAGTPYGAKPKNLTLNPRLTGLTLYCGIKRYIMFNRCMTPSGGSHGRAPLGGCHDEAHPRHCVRLYPRRGCGRGAPSAAGSGCKLQHLRLLIRRLP